MESSFCLNELFTSAVDSRSRYSTCGREGHGTIYFLLKEKRNNLVGFLLYNMLEISKMCVKNCLARLMIGIFKRRDKRRNFVC